MYQTATYKITAYDLDANELFVMAFSTYEEAKSQFDYIIESGNFSGIGDIFLRNDVNVLNYWEH